MIAPDVIFRRFTVGRYPINGYLLADRRTHIGAFIDPGGFHDEIGVFLREYEIDLRHLLFTHGHWDHTEGLTEFRQHYAVKCYAGAGEVRSASEVLHGGETIAVGQLQVGVLSTPGHTPGGLSFYCFGAVFTGDALFCGSVGGTFGEAAAERQCAAVRRNIFTLPDQTLVFPGHGPMSTVGAEKYANPFFRPWGKTRGSE